MIDRETLPHAAYHPPFSCDNTVQQENLKSIDKPINSSTNQRKKD